MLIGIVSDIHEDVTRLEEGFRVLEKRRVDTVVCLGDLVGYSVPFYGYLNSRNANKVIELVRGCCSRVVVGNHDLYAIRQIPTSRSFFDYPENWYSLDYYEREILSEGRVFLYEHDELASLLSTQNLDYLGSLPEYDIVECGDHRVLLTHYCFPDVTGSSTLEIEDPTQVAEHFAFMNEKECVYGFSGNDHMEGIKVFNKHGIQKVAFSRYALPDEPTWLHGPALARGMHANGVLVYDSSSREIEAIPLDSSLHTIPESIYF